MLNNYTNATIFGHVLAGNIHFVLTPDFNDQNQNTVIYVQIKNLFDKQNILNPDVKLTDDTKLHTKNLKELNSVDEQISKCMECSFCEPVVFIKKS